MWRDGISLYLQGTQQLIAQFLGQYRYIPVPTGNSFHYREYHLLLTVYPCTYRELLIFTIDTPNGSGISLYLQGTLLVEEFYGMKFRYIPVPTGNSSMTLS